MGRVPTLLALSLLLGCGRSGLSPMSADEGRDAPEPNLPETGATPAPGDDDDDDDDGDAMDGDLSVPPGDRIVLNVCVPLAETAGFTATLGEPGPFVAGRRVLLHQVTDRIDTLSSGETQAVTDPGSAGVTAIARVTAVGDGGTKLTLDSALPDFASDGDGRRAQVCTLPELANVVIAPEGEIAAQPWDGRRGGVVAFFAESLEIASGALVDAAGTGLRGGECGDGFSIANVFDFDTTEGRGGGKGESLDPRAFEDGAWGRGAIGNAGGGGNGRNGGGGGGGHAGTGGDGGMQFDDDGTDTRTKGLGGGAVVASGRMLLGGGGGAGHRDGFQQSGDVCGGNGGGVVRIRTAVLSGSGWIRADGADGSFAFLDGGSGGGAGGTVDVAAKDASAFAGAMTANGGDGGSVSNDDFDDFFGPGGGGGGGVVRVRRATIALVSARGGASGDNVFGNTSWGADNGDMGLVAATP